MYEFDHEEETLQADAETAEKVTIREASALPSVVTTGKTQIQDVTTHAPLHDESVIAVRDAFLDANEVSEEDGCPSRSMTIKAYNETEAESLDYQCVTLHVL